MGKYDALAKLLPPPEMQGAPMSQMSEQPVETAGIMSMMGQPPPEFQKIPIPPPMQLKKAAMQIMEKTSGPRQLSPIEQLQQSANMLTQRDLDRQQQGVLNLQKERDGLKGPQEMNPYVAMLMGLSDVASDSPNKKLPGYLQQQAAMKTAYEDKQQKYQENIQKAENDLSKERIALYGKQIADQKSGQVDEETRQMKLALMASGIERNKGVSHFNGPGGSRENMFDVSLHDKVTKRLGADKILGQRVTQYQNLSNAMVAISAPEVTPAEQVHEFQQAIRKNIGIGGSSGVGEREDTYIKTIGMTLGRAKQYLSGSPEDVVKNHPELIKHLKELAEVEMGNISSQKDKRIKAITSGYDKALYNRRTDLREDLNTAAEMSGQQFSTQPEGPPPGYVQENGEWVFKGGQ